METVISGTHLYDLQKLGMFIKSSGTDVPKWELTDIQYILKQSWRETGTVVFLTRDVNGLPVQNLDFIVGWQDNLTYPTEDYLGRYSFTMRHTYIPALEVGPYWAGFLEEGIAPEVHGFGIPKGNDIEIKIVYTRLEGGA